MSIRERQLVTMVDSALESDMKGGFIPSLLNVLTYMAKFVESFNPGEPTMQLEYVKQNTVNSPKKFNANLDRIYFDLKILYKEFYSQVMEILNLSEITNDKYQMLNNRLKSIKGSIETLVRMRTDPNASIAINEEFSTFENIDINLGGSGAIADVNINAGITLPLNDTLTSKVDFSFVDERSIEWVLEDDNYTNSYLVPGTTLKDAFSDIVNSWRHIVVSKDKKTIAGNFTFPLGKNSAYAWFSRIDVDMHLVTPVTVELFYESPSQEWIKLGQQTTSEKAIFIFDKIKSTRLRLRLSKDTYDYDRMTDDDTHTYGYIFGISNISVYDAYYERYASIQTDVNNPYSVAEFGASHTFDVVRINSDIRLPSADTATYFSIKAFEDEDDLQSSSFTNINLGEEVHLGTTDVVSDTVVAAGSFLEESNGIDFYEFNIDTSGAIIETIDVQRGVDNWRVISNKETVLSQVLDIPIPVTPIDESVSERGYGEGFYINSFLPLISGQLTAEASGRVDDVVRGSIVLSKQPGDTESVTYYTEGVDYILDHTDEYHSKWGEIFIPSGSRIISDSAPMVYADYSYYTERSVANEADYLYVCHVWLQQGTGLSVNMSKLLSSEYARLETSQGIVDFTRYGSNDTLSFPIGWSKLIIGLNNGPDEVDGQGNTAVDKISTIFGGQGIFSGTDIAISYKQRAFRESLKYVAEPSLKYSTALSDRSKFTVIDNKIVMNFLPGTGIYDQVRDTLYSSEKIYYKFNRIVKSLTKLIVKVDLERSDNNPNVTPVVRAMEILGRYEDE
jgi:hypothetical protein